MIKRVAALMILTLSIVACVAPLGAKYTSQTDVAVQEDLPTSIVITCYIVNIKPDNLEINDADEEETEEIEAEEIKYETHKLPETSGFKSYMSYEAITNKKSKQYQLQYEYAYTGDHGIRTYDDRYCIAVGTAYGATIGTYVDLVLANETVIPCIVAEIKADQHTDSTNRITTSNGCVSEFLVDTDTMHKEAQRAGDMSVVSDEWDSPVSEILVYEQNVFDTN